MVGGVLNLGLVDLISNKECSEPDYYPGSIDGSMICAGTLPNHDDVDACLGDSGGPLVIKVSNVDEEVLTLNSQTLFLFFIFLSAILCEKVEIKILYNKNNLRNVSLVANLISET